MMHSVELASACEILTFVERTEVKSSQAEQFAEKVPVVILSEAKNLSST